ncbi:hypothetical protein ACPF8X_43290 [Streptomyces sp. G35A]
MSGEVVPRLGVMLGAVSALAWLVREWDRARRARSARRRLAGVLPLEQRARAPRLTVAGVARSRLPYAGVACAGWLLVKKKKAYYHDHC